MQQSASTYQVRARTKKVSSGKAEQEAAPQAPVSRKEFELLKETVVWTADDEKYIRMSRSVLEDQTDDILDVWYSFFKVEPHLAGLFDYKKDHRPAKEHMEEMQARFKQWILRTAEAKYDRGWLSYELEIAPRHINFRYLMALVYPLTATLKPFLAKKHTHSAEDVECMHQAWIKAVLLQVCLWAEPSVNEGDH